MEITREAVLEWLEKERRPQKWLAAACGVSDQAASNWLREKNPRPISAEAKVKIARLMEDDAARSATAPPHNLVLEFNNEDYADIEQAALRHGITIREWAKRKLNELADMDIDALAAELKGSNSIEFPAKVAEDPVPYRVTKPQLMAAAGPPINAEMIEAYHGSDTVTVRISGLSMDPLFPDGSEVTALLKHACRSQAMKKGQIYLVSYDGGLTVKRYNTRLATPEEIEAGITYVSPRDGKTKVRILESVNPAFPEIVIKNDVDWIGWIDTNKKSSQ